MIFIKHFLKWLFYIVIVVSLVLVAKWVRQALFESTPAEVWYDSRVEPEKKSLISFPSDDSSHESPMEWWYYNGHLVTEEGKSYSYHYVIFVIKNITTHTVGHLSLTDHQTGRYYTKQMRTAGSSSILTKEGFDFTLGNWKLKGGNGEDKLDLSTVYFSLKLDLTDKSIPVVQGGDGLLEMGVAGNTYYYSRPRMVTRGTLTINGVRQSVTGQSWFDHQWGDFKPVEMTWDWFSLQLNDGANIMLYRIYDSDKNLLLSSGTWSQDGRTDLLDELDFTTVATKEWLSSVTNKSYPVYWKIQIPQKQLEIEIVPVVEKAEFDARTSTYDSYWEGAIKVSGTHTGVGFLEIRN